MAAMARLDERVTQLEMEMAEVRFLATKAEKEVTNVQMVLNGHTGTLNAIRHDQVDQVRELTRVKAEVNSLGAEMSAGFARVGADFIDVRTEMRNCFAK